MKMLNKLTSLTLSILLLFSASATSLTAATQQNKPLPQFIQEYQNNAKPILQKYCIQCHGPDKQKGKVRFDTLTSFTSEKENINLWLQILDQVHFEEMPPEDEKQPSPLEIKRLQNYINKGSKEAKKHLDNSDHTVTMRRLNKSQYKNTLRDLLKIDTTLFNPVVLFPEEEKKEHFKNIGSALVHSSFLFKEQLNIAKVIADKILLDIEQPKTNNLEFKPPYVQTREDKKTSESNYPGMSQANKLMISVGGNKFHNIYQNTELKKGYLWIHKYRQGVPASGFYKVTFKVQGRNQNYKAPEKLVHHDKREKLLATISVANEKYGAISISSPFDKDLETFELESDKWTEIGGTYWIEKGFSPRLSFPSGINKVKHIKTVMGKKEEYYNILYGKDGAPNAEALAAARAENSKKINNDSTKFRGKGNNWLNFLKAYDDVGPVLRCNNIKIEGPFYDEWPIPAYKNLLGSIPIQTSNPQEVIFKLAQKAFRSPIKKADIQEILHLMANEKKAGASNKQLLRMGITAVLCSDRFVYFDEKPGKLDSYAIANRLSYFLWSSIPDDTLMNLAKSGELNNPKVIQSQVQRMLHDKKVTSFIEDFVSDWLQLDKIGQMRPDPKQTKIYYRELLEKHMKNETFSFYADILKENKPVDQFLHSDYTYMNRGLGKFYGIKNYLDLPKNDYQKVALSDPKRGGLLGQMSVLTATANGVDTNPIIRGIWVLENILGMAPPPPPPNIPAVEPDVRGSTTIREQLEKHRNVESCNECHRKIDPAGWALESFDAIGQFRKTYSHSLSPHQMSKNSGMVINTNGKMHTGETFKDIVEFKKILLKKKDLFTRCLASKLLTYATGRTMEPMDNEEINRIVKAVSPNGARFQDILAEIVTSEIFLTK